MKKLYALKVFDFISQYEYVGCQRFKSKKKATKVALKLMNSGTCIAKVIEV